MALRRRASVHMSGEECDKAVLFVHDQGGGVIAAIAAAQMIEVLPHGQLAERSHVLGPPELGSSVPISPMVLVHPATH